MSIDVEQYRAILLLIDYMALEYLVVPNSPSVPNIGEAFFSFNGNLQSAGTFDSSRHRELLLIFSMYLA